MKDEALKLALEALEAWLPTLPHLIEKKKAAITAIKQALAAPVQKLMHPEIKKMYEDYFDKCFREFSAAVPENFIDALKFDVAMRDAAPVQEPVAWNEADELQCPICKITGRPYPKCGCITCTTPPAAQRQWVGLSQQERKDIWREAIGWGDPSHDDIGLMIAIEAKLKEKNT
jgi:hypothetical protein